MAIVGQLKWLESVTCALLMAKYSLHLPAHFTVCISACDKDCQQQFIMSPHGIQIPKPR